MYSNTKILIGLSIAILAMSIPLSFAQESYMSVQTNDLNYYYGDTIVISGQVSTVTGGVPIVIKLFFQDNLVEITQIPVALDGSYSYIVLADPPIIEKPGEYLVRASYNQHVAETVFSFAVINPSLNFEDNSINTGCGKGSTYDPITTWCIVENETSSPQSSNQMIIILEDIILELQNENAQLIAENKEIKNNNYTLQAKINELVLQLDDMQNVIMEQIQVIMEVIQDLNNKHS